MKKSFQDNLEELLLGNNFPYFLGLDTVPSDGLKFEDKNTIPGPQFTHLLVDVGGKVNSNYYYPNIQPIYSKLENLFDKDYYLSRCKINVNLIDNRFKNKYHTPHIDNWFEDGITAIYYVNDSDGDTIIFDNDRNIIERIEPKKGRLVYWEGLKFHAKQSPTKTNQRVIINFNLLQIGRAHV